MTSETIRPIARSDESAVHALLEQAFENPAEADLVDSLRRDGDLVLELVAISDDRLVGHIAYSSLQAPVWALALAPLSVAPPYQRRGIGTALMTESLELLRKKRWEAVFVLGDPAYYRRFGFSRRLAAPFDSAYSGEYFMALELKPDCLDGQRGDVRHAVAFGKLS